MAPFIVASTTVAAGSLASIADPAGNRIHVTAGSGAANAGRSLGQTVDSGSLYFSFSMQRLNETQRTINFALFAGTSEKLGFGQYATATVGATSAGNLAAVFLNSNPTNLVAGSPGVTPIAMGTGVAHQVIIRIDFNTNGSNDRVRIYLDPASVADEGTLTPYVDNSNFDMGAITSLRPFAGGTTTSPVALTAASGAFDEIRVGSTFAAVTAAAPLLPTLSIQQIGGTVKVLWPAPSTGWDLHQSDSLTIGTWTPSTGVMDDGTLKFLEIPSASGARFFRLAKP